MWDFNSVLRGLRENKMRYPAEWKEAILKRRLVQHNKRLAERATAEVFQKAPCNTGGRLPVWPVSCCPMVIRRLWVGEFG
jgi:hypothetical protein